MTFGMLSGIYQSLNDTNVTAAITFGNETCTNRNDALPNRNSAGIYALLTV